MNWRELLKFDPMRELRAHINNRLALLEARVARPIEIPAPPRHIVIWGVWLLQDSNSRTVRTVETVFSIGVPSGTRVKVCHDVYRPFKMTRWLLLGEGRVSDVLIGQNLQTAISGRVVLSGIAGRMGEGAFDTADVGVRISFEVVT